MDLDTRFFPLPHSPMTTTPLLLALSAVALSWIPASPAPVAPALPSGNSVGTNYCQALINSTGVPGSIEAFGSLTLADNDLTLVASNLPLDAFGYFIVSDTRGFVPCTNCPNLCLSGSIGRYVGPGEVLNTGTIGQVSLALDLNSMPQPMGSVAAMVGEEWNFQLWHRDETPFGPTTNMTNGVTVLFE